MSADSAVTYTSVHSEARSWSIPSEDPYEEAARQLLEQAPRSPEYVPADHVPVYIPEPEHPEDLVPAEDEAPTPLLPPSFLSPRSRPLSPRALERRADIPEVTHASVRDTTHSSPGPGCEDTMEIRFRDIKGGGDRLDDVTITGSYQVDVRSTSNEERETCLQSSEYGEPSALARSEAQAAALEAELCIETEMRHHELAASGCR
ncbi:hypothetical protein Tco_1272794 [Tanacetum coccineum]